MAIRLIISLLMNSIICALLFNSIQINNLKWCHNKERGTFCLPSHHYIQSFYFHIPSIHIDIRLVALRDWNSLFSFSAYNKKQILRGIYLPEYWPSCSKILTPLARMHSLESSFRVSCFVVSISSFKTNIKHQLLMKKMP